MYAADLPQTSSHPNTPLCSRKKVFFYSCKNIRDLYHISCKTCTHVSRILRLYIHTHASKLFSQTYTHSSRYTTRSQKQRFRIAFTQTSSFSKKWPGMIRSNVFNKREDVFEKWSLFKIFRKKSYSGVRCKKWKKVRFEWNPVKKISIKMSRSLSDQNRMLVDKWPGNDWFWKSPLFKIFWKKVTVKPSQNCWGKLSLTETRSKKNR